MEWGRTTSRDIVIAHHEAAHAVTAEHLAPHCVLGVSIDGDVPGFEGVNTTGLVAIGQVIWRTDLWPSEFEWGVAVWASRPGEKLVEEHVDPAHAPFKVDTKQFRALVPLRLQLSAARQAREIVLGNERRIRRLAEELLEHRVLDGDAVRHVIG